MIIGVRSPPLLLLLCKNSSNGLVEVGDFLRWKAFMPQEKAEMFVPQCLLLYSIHHLWFICIDYIKGMNAILLFPHPSSSLFSTMPSTPSSPSSSFSASHQILKLYAWEPSFQAQVEGIRGDELKVMRKFAYLTSVSTFVFSCAPALVSPVKESRKKRWEAAGQGWSFFLTLSFSTGFSGHIRSLCRGELRKRVDCWESFHFHLSFQHPPISPVHAAHAHCCHGASKGTTTHGACTHTKSTVYLKFTNLFFDTSDNSV